MADPIGITGQLAGASDVLMTIVIIGVSIILIIGFGVGLFFLMRERGRFRQFTVIILEKLAGGGTRILTDQAGIFTNKKTNLKLFFLKKAKIGLNPDNVSYIMSSNGKKVVFLLRVGLRNFIFLNPTFSETKFNFNVGTEDVSWAVNEYEANKKRFSQSLWTQLLPFMVLALVSIIILVMMIYLFKQFSVFKDVATSLQDVAHTLAPVIQNNLTNTGAKVIQGGVI